MRRSGRTWALVAGGVVGAMAVGGCGGASPVPVVTGEGVRAQVALTDASAVDGVVAATWRAGFATLATGEDDAGTVVSPASLVVALSMLAEGASGDSATALDDALGASGDARTDAVNALTATLSRFEGDPALVQAKELPDVPMVHLANQVVIDDDQAAQPAYLDRLVSGYGAGVVSADLSGPAGKKVLDAWVNENTGGLIKQSAVVPNDSLLLVLQNAVALAAAWQTPFHAEATHDDAFTTATGEDVQVPTMSTQTWFAYAEVDGWQAVRLPYLGGDGELYADVYLPPSGSDQATDPASADPDDVRALSAALDAAQPQEVVLSLPKLDLQTTTDLKDSLVAMGLGGLLAPETAGLDGLLVDPPAPPFVGQAVQQAVLKVDEEGTRAAAVTEIAVEAGSAPAEDPVEMRVDRPYLFVVTDGASGWPLFLASVLDPRS